MINIRRIKLDIKFAFILIQIINIKIFTIQYKFLHDMKNNINILIKLTEHLDLKKKVTR